MKMTHRQRQVVLCIARDMSYDETAKELGISRDTVRAHVFAIAQKIINPHGLPQKTLVVQWSKQVTMR